MSPFLAEVVGTAFAWLFAIMMLGIAGRAWARAFEAICGVPSAVALFP